MPASHVYPDSQNSQQLAAYQVMNQFVLSLHISLEQIVKLVSGLMEMQAIRANHKFELVSINLIVYCIITDLPSLTDFPFAA